MTLTELASYLRMIIEFKYITVDESNYVCLWNKKPKFGSLGFPVWDILGEKDFEEKSRSSIIFPNRLKNLDLSEYKDNKGKIDYSKCIVEVKK